MTLCSICLFVWLTSLSIIFSRSSHIATNSIPSFFFAGRVIVYTHINIYLRPLLYPSMSTDIYLGCSPVLAFVNSAAMTSGAPAAMTSGAPAWIFANEVFDFLKKKTLFIYLDCTGLGCSTQVWLLNSMWDFSSPAWDQTHVRCTGRPILSHRTAREVPRFLSFLDTCPGVGLLGHMVALWSWPSYNPVVLINASCLVRC